MGIFSKLFGKSVDLKEIAKGAVILDVRTPGEFKQGHIKGAVNAPLNDLNKHFTKLKNKDQAIITCCASGMRSASAKAQLKSQGFTNVHNGGGWMSLKSKLS
jgi:rhodanese-related sulfurtransferase